MDPIPVADAGVDFVAPADLEVIAVNAMDTALQWIGFENAATRNRLRIEGFDSFDDLKSMTEKDIRDLAESYGRRTVADGRFIFGIRRIHYLIGMVHWVQDFERVGGTASLDEFNDDPLAFRNALGVAFDRAGVRRIEKEQSDTVSKAADPGKFKDERKWPEWEPAFANYLSTIPGVTGVPLSYVIRETEVPEDGMTYESFNERAIASAPLVGASFQADARKVHQLIKGFLQTETAEQWVKPHARKQNGRIDFKALRAHYSGEGNTSRRIADAERIRDTLHYKNERAMQFSAFLDKIQKMFNIYEEEGEPMTEQAKVRMLLSKVEHPQLKEAVGALRVRASMDGTTFTECANHLSAQVSELPDNQVNRKVAGANTDRGKTTPAAKRIRGGGSTNTNKRKGIKMPDGSIWTGFYSDWDQLSKEDRQTVIDTRIENKSKGGRKRQVSDVSTGNKKLKDIKSQMEELKRTLASFKAKQPATEDGDDSDTPDNAGDSFGGRTKKKQKKE
ncbi:hypothetical protein MHU86_17804 [Fragilaria crotonensis]|nr:hypothetical protein MHU86_17804 [Fragilaria crotonensis]